MHLEEQHAVEFSDGSGEELTVWVGGAILVGDLPSTGRLVVVEGEPERAQELRQKLAKQPETQVYEEVLTAENGVKVQWHRFNDARLNGPSDLRTWQQHFPNLRQIHEELRCGRRLGELLDNWAYHKTGQVITALHLKLRQGDPLAALAGLGSWINQLETVQLMLPWPRETMSAIDACLTKHNFRQDLESAVLWKRDPLATRDRLLQEKEKECRKLNSDKCLLVQKLQAEEAINLNMRKALKILFPVEIYRKNNIDLGDIDEDSLAIHYLEHGLQQGQLKTYQELDEALKSSLKRCEEAETKLEQLEAHFGLVKQQLEILKDVFTGLTEKPELPQSTTEE